MYQKVWKRLLDLVLSGMALFVFAIPMGIVSIIIKKEDPGPVVFCQQRVGKGKRLFTLYKFRTMKLSAPKDVPTHLFVNPEQYLLRCGRVIRHYSIDELPQLWNIIRGDMSIIGPRPALWNQDDLIAERDRYGANDIKPGLTGWAQINGRDELEIPIKAQLDGVYAQNLSFAFDCRCLFGTVGKVLRGDGISEGMQNLETTEQEKEVISWQKR